MFRLCAWVCVSPCNTAKNKGKKKQAEGRTTGEEGG